jgi:hypothetical protein
MLTRHADQTALSAISKLRNQPLVALKRRVELLSAHWTLDKYEKLGSVES